MANEADAPTILLLESGEPDGYLLEDGSGVLLKDPQDYGALVVDDGAICYFRFNEASGTFIDSIGQRVGTPTGTVFTYAQTGALVGDSDTGVLLATNTPYISVPGDAALGPAAHSNNLTIECWLRGSGLTAPGAFGYFVDFSAIAGVIYQFRFLRASATAVGIAGNGRDSAGASLFNATGNSIDGLITDWHHIVVVMDGSTVTTRWYVDTQPDPGGDQPWGGTGSFLAWTTQNLSISGDNSHNNPFLGVMDELAIYPTALTVDQIARHYRCGLQFLPDIPPPLPSLAAH